MIKPTNFRNIQIILEIIVFSFIKISNHTEMGLPWLITWKNQQAFSASRISSTIFALCDSNFSFERDQSLEFEFK